MQGTILCMFGRKTERQHVLNGIYLYRSKRHVACFLSFSLFFLLSLFLFTCMKYTHNRRTKSLSHVHLAQSLIQFCFYSAICPMIICMAAANGEEDHSMRMQDV